MTKLGLLPGLDGDYFKPTVALMQNDCGSFQNRWVTLGFDAASPCIFTRGVETIPLPVRHGEGKLFTDPAHLAALEQRFCVPCRYIDPATGAPTQEFPLNPNGSLHAIAGLCDPTGRIFGLMPHPEAFLLAENHPLWDHPDRRGKAPARGQGLKIFENAVRFLKD
jgi:phosphoribosylformylglycinamidine synthase